MMIGIKQLKKGLEIIKGGFISEETPLFRTCYNYETKSYSKQDEINIIDYLKDIASSQRGGYVSK